MTCFVSLSDGDLKRVFDKLLIATKTEDQTITLKNKINTKNRMQASFCQLQREVPCCHADYRMIALPPYSYLYLCRGAMA